MATQAEVATHLDLSQQAVSQMLNEGTLPRGAGRGGLDLDACRVAYIVRLREQAAGRGAGDGDEDAPDLATERALLARAQREGQNLKNGVLRGELLPVEDVEDAISTILVAVRAKMLTLPTKAAPKVLGLKSVGEGKDILTVLVHEALSEASSMELVVQDATHRARKRLGRLGAAAEGSSDAEAAATADGQ